MRIFKCSQRLWRFSRGSRLFQWLCITGALALIIGIAFFEKSSVEEKAFSCFRDEGVVLFFLSSKALTPHVSLPIQSAQSLADSAFTDIIVKGTKWKMAAFRVFSVGDLMAELSMEGSGKCLFPIIAVVQDSAGAEYLIIGNEEKQISLSSMSYLVKHCMRDQRNKKWVKVIVSGSEKNENDPLSLCLGVK